MTTIIADIPLTPEIGATVSRPVLRHDKAALANILQRLDETFAPADAVLWLISPHPALSNKHPIWCGRRHARRTSGAGEDCCGEGARMKPRALDLFCGAGGTTKGLQRAGFHVTGVDIKRQPRYCGDAFVQADALRPPFDLSTFDFIWASPPCQHDSQLTPRNHRAKHKPMIAETRAMLAASGIPFCIENVPSAAWRLKRPLKLCGSMFGLGVRRHRYFELGAWFPPLLLPPCDHSRAPVLISGTHRRSYEPRYEYTAQQCRDAAGLQWMRRTDMDNAIPPAYAEFIGRAALVHLRAVSGEC